MAFEDTNVAADFINKALELKSNKITGKDIIREKQEYITSRFDKKEVDVLYKLKDKNIYFLIEHQSTVDYFMPYRIMEYQVEILRSNSHLFMDKKEKIPRVIAIVIYTGKNNWNVEQDIRNMQEEFRGTKTQALGVYNLIDIHDYTKQELLDKENLIYDLLLVEKSKNIEELKQNLQEISRKVDTNKELLEKIIQITMIPVIGKAKTEELIKQIYKKDKEGDNMLAASRMLLNEMQMNRDLGREEGIRKGRKEGRKEGIYEIAKKMLKDKIGIETIKKWTGLTEKEIEEIK